MDLVVSELPMFTDSIIEHIKRVIEYGKRQENWFDPQNVFSPQNKPPKVQQAENNSIILGNHSCMFTYSVMKDEKYEITVWRQLSIRLTNSTSLPHPLLVDIILPYFEFTKLTGGVKKYEEDFIVDSAYPMIVVMQKLDDIKL